MALPGAGCATFGQNSATKTTAAKPPAPAVNAAATPGEEVLTFLAQAQQARQSGDAGTAVKLLSQLVLIAPDDPRVLGEYGKALAAEGRSDDALAFLERAIQLQPGDWTLHSAQGVAYDQQGKFQSAQLSYSRALALKPGEPVIINNDALSHIQAGDFAGAGHLLSLVPPGSPDYARISKSLALLQQLKPAEVPAAAAIEQAHQIAAAPRSAPEHAAAVNPAPAIAVPAAKQDIALVTVTPAAATPVRTTLETLKSDPAVLMEQVPAEAAPRVRAETGESKTSAAAVPAPGGHYFVQAGAYLSDARARQALTGLETLDVKIMQAVVNGREMFRLRMGPFTTMAEARSAYSEAKAHGRSDLFIVRE